ncbi:MAG: SpoIIE family protein phosphatase [Clostridia bacterium]|nr:SpoIIE family protein phosphatase [Clostridia bacterium]
MQNTEKKRAYEEGAKQEGLFKRIAKRLEQKNEDEVRERLRVTVRFFLVAATAYLLSGVALPLGIYPIMLSLVCSHKRFLLPIVAGVAASAIGGSIPAIYYLAAVSILAMRVVALLSMRLLREEKQSRAIVKYGDKAIDESKNERLSKEDIFDDSLGIRVISGAVGGLIVGVYLVTVADFSFYSAMQTLLLTFAVPIITLALSGFFGREREIAKIGKWEGFDKIHRIISLGAIFFLCVLAGHDRSLLGMPMAPFLATLITLFVCSGNGILYGGLTALVCGAALEIIYLPLLFLMALLFCLVSAVKRNMGLPAVCALIVVWCYYIGGERGLLAYLPPMLLAIPFYYIADKYREMMSAPHLYDGLALSGIYFAEAVTEKTKNEVAYDRLEALSGAFSSLSETFYKLSDRFRRTDLLGIKRIAETSFEKHCEGCRNREICLGTGYEKTLDAINKVSSELHKKGSVDKDSLPESFRSVCLRHERIVDEVNRSIQRTTEEVIRGEKANIFSMNYGDITTILKDALENGSEEYESNIEESGKVFDILLTAGMRPRGVVVYGKRCRHVVARGVVSGDKISSEKSAEIRREISKIVGAELGEPTFEIGKDGNIMIMHSKPSIKAYCAHGGGNTAKEEQSDDLVDEYVAIDPFSAEIEEVCGDTTSAFLTDASYFYSLISDGMGSGGDAAFTSNVCAMFIEKMLCAGNRADITLRMLNNVIRSENLGVGAECSATVDLFELDLMNGSASFIKSGAAPTYVARGGTVYKISSRTMPVGIIKDADARITRFDTQKGDLVVMISDGCCPDSEDCAWLVEYLCAYAKKSAKSKTGEIDEDKNKICERIRDELLAKAAKNYPADRTPDDISVSVILID